MMSIDLNVRMINESGFAASYLFRIYSVKYNFRDVRKLLLLQIQNEKVLI